VLEDPVTADRTTDSSRPISTSQGATGNACDGKLADDNDDYWS